MKNKIKAISTIVSMSAFFSLIVSPMVSVSQKTLNADGIQQSGKITIDTGANLSTYKSYARYEGIKFNANCDVANRTFVPSDNTAIMIKLDNYSNTVKYTYYLNGTLDRSTSTNQGKVYKYDNENYVSSISLSSYALGVLGQSTNYNFIVIPTTHFIDNSSTPYTFNDLTIAVRMKGVADSNLSSSQANADIYGIYLLDDFNAENTLNSETMYSKPLYLPYTNDTVDFDSGNTGITSQCITATYHAPINITLPECANGELTLNKETYYDGEKAEILINPNKNYEIDSFTVNGVDKISEIQNGKYVINSLSENIDIDATFKSIEYIIEGIVTDNTIAYTFPIDKIDLSEVKGIAFDFDSTTTTSYNIEIKDSLDNIWTTNGKKAGITGDKGSGILLSNKSNASAYYTNVFDSIAAGNYKVYIPFEFYTGKTEKENNIINPVYKIKGYTDKYGISVNDTTYDLPLELSNVINFISSSNDNAIALNNAISNIELVVDDSVYSKTQLNIDDAVKNNSLNGYNEDASRSVVEFNTDSATMIKWTASTGISASAGFLLKMGNTGLNDVRIRVEVSDNSSSGATGTEIMTESYSGSEVKEDEYYRFIHSSNSTKSIGTEEKLYVTSRQITLPVGYQGDILVPFTRLRYQTSGYINPTDISYNNGRFDSTLGAIRLYVKSVNEGDYKTNSLTFYVLNSIKAADGLGVSFKKVSSDSKITPNSTSQATVLNTSLTNVTSLINTLNKNETISITTPNSGSNASKLFVGQSAKIAVNNLNSKENYTAKLSYVKDNVTYDISNELVVVSSSDSSITYSYKKIIQSRGDVTFTLESSKKMVLPSVFAQGAISYTDQYKGVIRIFGVTDSIEYDNYGITFEYNGVSKDILATPYERIYSYSDASYSYTASDLVENGEYIFGLEIYEIPLGSYEFSITSWYEVDENRYISSKKVIIVNVSEENGTTIQANQ